MTATPPDPPPTGRQKGAKLFLLGSALAQICALARYVLLARILGPEQLGFAAILILTAQLFAASSDAGADRFVIQDSQGDEPEVQRLAQLVAVGRGSITALGLAAVAYPISLHYSNPTLGWATLCLALSPFLLGFLHLDMRRQQRRRDFRAEGLGIITSELAAFVVMGVAAWFLKSFIAVAFGLIARSLVMTITSHLTRERRYEIGFSKAHWPRLARFSAPLIANGMLLFLAGQGDRLVMATTLGPADLGRYAAVMLLALYPTSLVMRYLSATQLPKLAGAKADSARLGAEEGLLGGACLAFAAAIMTGYTLVGPYAVELLYGADFRLPTAVFALIAALQAGRMLRQWPTTAALALGRSGIVLTNNAVRAASLPVAFVVAIQTKSLEGVLVALVVGEVAATIVALVMLRRACAGPALSDATRIAAFVGVAVLAWLWGVLPALSGAWWAAAVALAVFLGWIGRQEAPTLRLAAAILHNAIGRRRRTSPGK
ncbi:MAG: oligosaccharide flippase family protein [Phenylobacterium sp.]|uniref:oligosaccharide flippase family protein n=1 Tax=Phenylobacterium sp. TaxID=1871053 RepID=UPI00391DA523